MSSNYHVYTEDENRPSLITPDFADALAKFLEGVMNGEGGTKLVWSP